MEIVLHESPETQETIGIKGLRTREEEKWEYSNQARFIRKDKKALNITRYMPIRKLKIRKINEDNETKEQRIER